MSSSVHNSLGAASSSLRATAIVLGDTSGGSCLPLLRIIPPASRSMLISVRTPPPFILHWLGVLLIGKLLHNHVLVGSVIVTLIFSDGSVGLFAVLFTLNENSRGGASGILKSKDCPIVLFSFAVVVILNLGLSIRSLNLAKSIP